MDTSVSPSNTGNPQHWHHKFRKTPLERLPVEIVQKIFFECLEINLPRASLPIALALSNDVIYTWLIRLAFSSNNESALTDFFTKPYLPLDYFSLTAPQRATLQTEILKCRWCTLPLMRKCQREHVEHVLRQKCNHLIISPSDRRKLENLEPYWGNMDRITSKAIGSRGTGDLRVEARIPEPPPEPQKQQQQQQQTSTIATSTSTNPSNASATTNTTTTTNPKRRIAIWFNFGSVQIRPANDLVFEYIDVFRLPYGGFSDPCRIPDHLLRPPWTPEKLEFLTLLSTEAYIDEDSRYERSKATLRQVITDRDFDTFKHMLTMRIRVKVYGYTLRWPLKQNHFRLAARLAGGSDNDPFLKELFEERREDVPVSDPSIRALMNRYDARKKYEGEREGMRERESQFGGGAVRGGMTKRGG
ncbi:hypothetical protein FQN52_007933 [Onygenales sp. PD_12]|nr:hypothetical protein FQN52_007933 [Onygenales sp. PD_12]